MTNEIYSWFTRDCHATPAATPDEQRVRDAEIANLKRFAVLGSKPVEYEPAAGGFKPTEQSKKDAVEFVRLRDAIKHSLATGKPAESVPIRLTAANGPQWEELPAIEPEPSTPAANPTAANPTAEEAAKLEASRAAWDAFSKQFAGFASQYFQALENAVRQVREQLVEFVREHKKEMKRLAAEVMKPREPFRLPDRPEPRVHSIDIAGDSLQLIVLIGNTVGEVEKQVEGYTADGYMRSGPLFVDPDGSRWRQQMVKRNELPR